MNSLERFFEPQSIAVVGASRSSGKLGHLVLKNVVEGGYKGLVYPVNPKSGEIMGLQSYPDVEQIPYEVDLAIIVIPAQFVVPVVKQCANKGVKGVIVISAGFGEVNEQGKVWENQMKEIARVSGMRILGPNCLGFINPKINLNASFGKNLPKTGDVGFISQSGAFGTAMLDWAEEAEVGFNLFVSIGNKTDINENDILEYWSKTNAPKVVVSYLEDISDGTRFNELNEKLTQESPHLILKPGRTEAAQQAIKSHTGALAGSDLVVSTALKQFGCLRAEGMHDLFDMVRTFSLQPKLKGDRVAVVTNAGGPAVMTTDFIELNGLRVARFDERTAAVLREKLPREANIQDPVDVIGDALADRYAAAIDAVLGDPNVDGMIVLLTPQVMTQINETADYIGRLAKTHGKTVTVAFVGGKFVEEGRDRLEELGIPVYHYPDRAALALKAMNEYRLYVGKKKAQNVVGSHGAKKTVDVTKRMQIEEMFTSAGSEGRQALTPSESLQVAQVYDLRVPESKIVKDEEDAMMVAEEIGYPVVMKISTEKLLHKTEVQGVELNLSSRKQVIDAYQTLRSRLANALKIPADKINGGIEVQKQITGGHEVLIGVKKDENFGHLILFGMGGIYTEIYKDFSSRLTPISLEEARGMINETLVSKVLKGYRNLPERDIGCIAECIVNISRLVGDFPVIDELDVNPLIVLDKGSGCVAVDVKITFR